MTKGIDLLLEQVRKASDESLLMSRMNCHAKNVSSIVLRNAGGRLSRAFLAWPGHRLHTNRIDDDLEVGVHDHRYDIWLSLIHGDVENVIYERCRDGGVPLLEFRFRSGVTTGWASTEIVSRSSAIRESGRERLEKGNWVGVDKDVLHDIEARGVCAWLVQEGDTVKDTTTLLAKREFSTDGLLYQKFATRRDVIEHVSAWAAEASK